MPPAHLARPLARLNQLVRSELGENPRFQWMWGRDLEARIPILGDDGKIRKRLHTTESPSGLVLVRHEDEVDVRPYLPAVYWNCFIFCREDKHPMAPMRWMPWCPPHAVTPEGERIQYIHSPAFALPPADYAREVIRVCRIHLRERAKGIEAQLKAYTRMLEEKRARDQDRSIATSLRKSLDALPVGLNRQAGDKSHVSFPGVPQ